MEQEFNVEIKLTAIEMGIITAILRNSEVYVEKVPSLENKFADAFQNSLQEILK